MEINLELAAVLIAFIVGSGAIYSRIGRLEGKLDQICHRLGLLESIVFGGCAHGKEEERKEEEENK